ncbi:hypothetical protein MD484_g5197, partial [Candolleomyces efflorescens]
MSRPVSHPAVTEYQPRFSSPLSAPPIQESPPKHDLPVLSDRNPYGTRNRNVLTRSSALYARGQRRVHGRSISAPIVQHQALPVPVNHAHLDPRPKPTASTYASYPSETLNARVVSNAQETQDVTDFQAHFNVTTTYPPRPLPAYSHPLKTSNKPLPPRPHSSPNRPPSTLQDPPPHPLAAPTSTSNSPHSPHAAIPLPRRPPSSITRRPHSSTFSDSRSRDDESRELLARMAAHSRTLSSEKRYWEAVPRISAPKEGQVLVQYQQPQPKARVSMVRVAGGGGGGGEGGVDEYGVNEQLGGTRRKGSGLGMWKFISGVSTFRGTIVSSLSFDVDCVGGGSNSESTERPLERSQRSEHVEDLHTRLGFRRRSTSATNVPNHDSDHTTTVYTSTPPPAPSMSKLRTLRLSKLRRSRPPSITFDVPLTTIQPRPQAPMTTSSTLTSTVRGPTSGGE